jgi:hypothetical protein
VRIVSLADTLDAMTSERPYRNPLSLGTTLHELVRLTPEKFDVNVVQALLIQVRREMAGSGRGGLLPAHLAGSLAPADVDQLAATLQHKTGAGRKYLLT